MNYWIIVSAILGLICVGTCIVYIQQRRELLMRRERDSESEQIRQENEGVRRENVSLRREIAALCRDVEEEQRYSGELEAELDAQDERISHAEERADRAEARRTEAEKEIYASRMRAEQLAQQLKQCHQEQLAQEQLYQDIIRERDLTIAKLQENPQKRRTKKKVEVLDQQITLDDLFNQEAAGVDE